MSRIFFIVLALIANHKAHANECYIIQKLQHAEVVKIKVDGGTMLVKFTHKKHGTAITVSNSPDPTYVPFFKGAFQSLEETTINGKTYCLLSRSEPVQNSLAITTLENENVMYVGLGSTKLLTDAIENGDYLSFSY